jgi:hypothetical protein
MTIQRRWRKWLTDNLVDRWLTSGRYYQLNLVSGDHQNPEYRIADDVRIATEAPVDFVTGVTTAFLSAATFVVVLCNPSTASRGGRPDAVRMVWNGRWSVALTERARSGRDQLATGGSSRLTSLTNTSSKPGS